MPWGHRGRLSGFQSADRWNDTRTRGPTPAQEWLPVTETISSSNKINTHIPGHPMTVPGLSVAIPGLLVAIPGLSVTIPGLSVIIPGLSVAIPGLSVAIPGQRMGL